MRRTNFQNLRVYQLSEKISDTLWDTVLRWERLAQFTVGKQLINAADSVGANIAEGTGRGSAAENKRFAKIARGSLFEVKHWLRRAYQRNLLSEDQVKELRGMVEELTPKLSSYINSIDKRRDKKSKAPSGE
jgi:four helix bundle protein